jgi:hypothetical protein
MELETTFYIIGIICMSLITLILIGLIIVAVMIKAKINHIHDSLQAKVRPLAKLANKAEEVVSSVTDKAKDALGK